MKKILKKILPVNISNKLRAAEDASKLNRLPIETCDFEALRKIDSQTLSQIFNNEDLKAEYQAIRPIVKNLGLPEDTGGVNIGDQQAIFYLIKHFEPQNVLEVGTFIGCSTVHIALAQKDKPDAKLTTVDIRNVNDPTTKPWINHGSKSAPSQNITEVGCADKVTFIAQDSKKYLTTYDGPKYDFIFLDGSHKATEVYLEIPKSLNILAEGGIILLHDYFPDNAILWKDSPRTISGPYLGVERLRKENKDMVHAVPFGNLPWKTKLGTNTTSLAIFTKK